MCRLATGFCRYCFRSERLGCGYVAINPGQHADEEDGARHRSAAISPPHAVPSPEPWPRGDAIDDAAVVSAAAAWDLPCLARVSASHFDRANLLESRALLVLHNGHIVHEQYAPGFNMDTRLHGWSMTKSLLHALVGVRLRQGGFGPAGLDTTMGTLLEAPSQLHPGISGRTLRQMLRMSDGLDIDEV